MHKNQALPPRTAVTNHPTIQQFCQDASHPAVDSISWRLWETTQDIAQLVFSTEYVQGIADGTLTADTFYEYTLQDCAYCYRAQQDFVIMKRRAQEAGHSQLSAFVQARYERFDFYITNILHTLNLIDASEIVPTGAALNYISFEESVSNNLPPIYGALAMVPCSQLWAWLAEKLSGVMNADNVYRSWFEHINSWEEVFCPDNFFDAWFARNPQDFQWETALYVYRSSMISELNFFRSAFEQSLMPMPQLPERTS